VDRHRERLMRDGGGCRLMWRLHTATRCVVGASILWPLEGFQVLLPTLYRCYLWLCLILELGGRRGAQFWENERIVKGSLSWFA
jgi:hypothetical protein